MPVYNVEEKWLRRCIDSILIQDYTNWELCMADDASTDPKVKELLTEYQESDKRIKVFLDKKMDIFQKQRILLLSLQQVSLSLF